MPSRLPPTDAEAVAAVARLGSLRQHQHQGQRSPHKLLLVLLALGRLAETGSSAVPWSAAESELVNLIAEFGPPSRTGRAQSAAYPFTRLKADGVWLLDHGVPNDLIRPLADGQVTGRLESSIEAVLRSRPDLLRATARDLVLSNFPETVAPDVLEAAGLNPDEVLGTAQSADVIRSETEGRRRSARWRADILLAWDRQCAFCGYDGQFRGASVGIEAAHVRWFAFGGPDTLNNGLALCALQAARTAADRATRHGPASCQPRLLAHQASVQGPPAGGLTGPQRLGRRPVPRETGPVTLIVVSGAPGTGKSTIAAAIAADLRWPVLSLDPIKELLADVLGLGDEDWSDRLGDAAAEIVFRQAASFPAAVAEGWWRRARRDRAVEVFAGAVEVFCRDRAPAWPWRGAHHGRYRAGRSGRGGRGAGRGCPPPLSPARHVRSVHARTARHR